MCMRLLLVCSLVLAPGVAACGGDPEREGLDPNVAPHDAGSWWRPDQDTTWQWQLLGSVNTSYDVAAYDIDLFDSGTDLIAALHAAGRKVICYFSAGSAEDWRGDFARFAGQDLGEELDGWPGEYWLDVRSPAVLALMLERLDLAVAKGCDGVEPDNVDGYANDSGFDLSADNQLGFNRQLANAARARGLAVGLKNDLDQVPDLLAYFDFMVNEQCHEYEECDTTLPFVAAGKPVFNAEYPASAGGTQALAASVCPAARAADLRTLVLPLDLDDSFRVTCDP